MTRRTAFVGVAAFLLTGGTFLAQQAGNWQVLMYPDPEPGVARTWCLGINDPGDMVGYYVIGSSNRASLLAGGEYYSVLPAGATSSTAYGINARGDIVGNYTAGGVVHGFLLRHDEFITIDLEGPAMTHPRGINARGDIAGFYMTTPTSPEQGFVLDRDGTVTDVRYPGARSTTVSGINDNGDVTGPYTDASGGVHGFVRTEDGDFSPIDYPGAFSTTPQEIGANGTVVGYYYDNGTPRLSHGFVLRHGEFEQVDYPGASQTMIHGANTQGETCGMMSFTPAGTTPVVWGGFGHVW